MNHITENLIIKQHFIAKIYLYQNHLKENLKELFLIRIFDFLKI